MKCSHCGKPKAKNMWTLQACADGRKKRKKRLCDSCDIDLNRMVLKFFNDEKSEEKLEQYQKKMSETA